MIFAFSNKLLALSALSLGLLLPNFLLAHVPGVEKGLNQTTGAVNVRAPEFILVNQANQRFDSTQLRGKAADRQVKNARIGLAHNLGGPGAISSVSILTNQP